MRLEGQVPGSLERMYYVLMFYQDHGRSPKLGTWCLSTSHSVIQQGNHCTGKTGKMGKKNPCQGKHRELEILPKHRENTFGLPKL